MATDDQRRPTREELQREEAQEARWGSFEHGAPETGPGEDMPVDNLRKREPLDPRTGLPDPMLGPKTEL